MLRNRVVRLFWPLAIWMAVFGWRTVACKKKEEPAGGRGARPRITYHYPTPQPTFTYRPGVSPAIPPE